MNVPSELVKIAKDLVSQDASTIYKKRYQEVERLLSNIQRKLRDHEKRQKKDTKNWGFAGDLEHVVEQLKEIFSLD